MTTIHERWVEFEQNTRMFFLEVHAVTRSFFGEQDWKWFKESNQNQASRWEAFEDEMMTEVLGCSNVSDIGPRITLGVGAALYAIPYGLGRMVYDGILDVVEYTNWRITGQAYTPSHPGGRNNNAYVLGTPLAAPFILLGGILEVMARVAGFSRYGGHIISAAAQRSTNLSKYTRELFGESSAASIAIHQSVLKEKIKSGWDVADRIGYVTFPGILAAGSMMVAVTITGMGFLGELIYRLMGFSERGKHMRRIMDIIASNIMGVYFPELRRPLSKIKKAAHQIVEKPSLWDLVNYPGMLLPFVLGAALVAGSAYIISGIGLLDTLRRAVGFSERGQYMLSMMAMIAGNTLCPYFPDLYTPLSKIKEAAHQIIEKPSLWDLVNYPGMLLPFVLGVALVAGSAYITSAIGLFDILRRAVGFSERGQYMLDMMTMIAGNVLGVYFPELRSPLAEIKEAAHQIVEKPSLWDIVNYPGMLLPFVVGVLGVAFFACITGGIGLLDTLRRAVGFSERSQNGVLATLVTCGHFFGFSHPSKHYIQKLTEPVRSWWDVCDVIGMGMSCAIVGLTAATLSTLLALIGFSKSNYQRFNYYRHRINNDISERFNAEGVAIDRRLENDHARQLKECESTHTGLFFSRVNVFNILGQTLYAIARYVVAPMVYVFGKVCANLVGIVPLARLATRPSCDLNTDEGRIRERFAYLRKCLNEDGHFPAGSLTVANDQSFWSRFKFSLFSEGRQMMSLGHTPEEKVLNEFSSKFEEFVRTNKRARRHITGEAVNMSSFFQKKIPLPKGERFEYDAMVNDIKQSCVGADREKVDTAARLIRNEIETIIRKKRM